MVGTFREMEWKMIKTVGNLIMILLLFFVCPIKDVDKYFHV